MQIYGEKCYGIKNPAGISTTPDFSWRLRGKNGENQRGYRIFCYEKTLGENKLLWDSGEVKSECCHRISYEGPALASAQEYLWQVEVKTQTGETVTGEMQQFSTGILDESLWSAKWIQADFDRKKSDDVMEGWKIFAGLMPYLEHPEEKLNPCLYFQTEIQLEKKVKKATLFATAHGIYEACVNGKSYGQPLAPGYTKYAAYQEYQSYDITSSLKAGINVIGAVVADGWYTGKIGLLGAGDQYGDTTAFFAQLMVEYEDGSSEIFGTDESWRAGTGAYMYADLFVGEGYDASKEPEGWMEPGYVNNDWKPVLIRDYGYSQLKGRTDEPAACVRIQKPKALFRSPKGELILDVGENISGYISFSSMAETGTKIKLEHGEVLDKEGNFQHNILGQNKNQTDVYIAGKDGMFSYCPKFTFHGFQYVRITGFDEARLEDFKVHVLATDMERTGEFRCSDPRLNQLQENIFRSQQGNMLYVPTDCPQREKAGWTGDMQAYAPTAAYLMDVEAFLEKWLANMRLEQLEDGRIPDVIPDIPSNRLISPNKEHCSSGWGDACVIIPYRLYQAYGDIRILHDNYPMMLRWMAYIENKAATEVPEGYDTSNTEGMKYQKYLWNTGFHYGDWLIPSLSGKGSSPEEGAELTKELVAPAMYAYTTSLMKEISHALKETEQEAHFTDLNEKIKEAYAHEYLLPDGKLKIDYQGMYVLALQMGLIPVNHREAILARLLQLIEENDGCLDTGFLSMPFLLDVLCDNGRTDKAYDLLYQEKCPSWLYEIRQGANTIWESWNNILEDGTRRDTSYNHFAFGCVGDFMYRRILGLNIKEAGYKKMRIAPALNCRLDWAEGSHETVYGKVWIHWEKEDDKAVLIVEIPPNTEAEVEFAGKVSQVPSGRHIFVK